MEFHIFCFVCFLLQQIFLTDHAIRCFVCSWHLVAIVLEVWHTHTLLHSHGMKYMPHVVRPRSSLPALKVLIAFFTGIWIVLILCLASSLLKLDVKCWYGSQATPVVFSVAVSGLFLVCRSCWISQLLYPSFLNVCFRCCISSCRLSSQMVCAWWMRVERTALLFLPDYTQNQHVDTSLYV
jgi:hypothetical protein